MSEIFLAPEEQRNAFASDKKQKKRQEVVESRKVVLLHSRCNL